MQSIDLDIHTIDVEKFQSFVVVDIRETPECDAFPPATQKIHFIPLSEIENKINFFKEDKQYLLICAKGGRSHYLAGILQSRGIHALSVNNGMASFNKYLKDHGLC